MTMWINTQTQARYTSLADIRSAFPQVSFPADMGESALADVGVAAVQPVEPPAFDPETERAEELPPALVNGAWTQQWAVRDLTPEELAARLQARREAMVVSRFQAEAALHLAGVLDDVEAVIADPATDPLVQIAWNRVTEFRRLSPMIAGIALALGWSDAQLDQLFETAAGIEA